MAQGARKIGFAGFQRAVELLAEERRCDVEAVRRAVVLSGGPHANTHVTPDYVRLHDDKSTYSGAAPPCLLLERGTACCACDHALGHVACRPGVAQCRPHTAPGGARAHKRACALWHCKGVALPGMSVTALQ